MNDPAAMLQQMLGGGGGGVPPQGMPPAMGAAMGQRSGGGAQNLIGAIASLMQDPQIQQMVGPMLASLGGGGGGDPRAAFAGQQDMGPPYSLDQMPPGRTRTNFGPGPMGDGVDEGINDEEPEVPTGPTGQPMSTEEELAATQKAMGEGEDGPGDWQGSRAPTQEDIDFLTKNANEEVVESFNAKFGEGAAEQYLGDDEEGPSTNDADDYDDEDNY